MKEEDFERFKLNSKGSHVLERLDMIFMTPLGSYMTPKSERNVSKKRTKTILKRTKKCVLHKYKKGVLF
jgi:hypothetical protein